MRKILFRGKRIDNSEWVEVQTLVVIHQDDNDLIFMPQHGEDVTADPMEGNDRALTSIYGNYYQILPQTVGQYTGLTDKNGRKVFEGDIVDFDDEVWESYYTSCGGEYDSWEVKNCGVVGFDEDRSCFDFIKYKFSENSVEADLHENHDIEFAEFISELEVIGNIHDNPELLEVTE